ncbi:hypothetical protein NUW58_g5077 [Xylaria curta]|uniref:Uncharacterized protein n=1 Tax=Xylaria curta TaxID=42375 RepID=A0ACC1P455_9PEZI|nr:hypothetical protein NUW58_g5077 [Xylaria curta]
MDDTESCDKYNMLVELNDWASVRSGAHGLKKIVTDPAKLASFATAAHYQLLHSVALLVATRAAPENKLAAGLFTAGMTMFSGSIYALVLDPARFRFLGPVTPLGGLCLIGGWAALAF